MNPEEKTKKEVWTIIKQIKELLIISNDSGLIEFKLNGENQEFSIERQIDLLYLLANAGIINTFKVTKFVVLGEPNVAPEPEIIEMDINHKRFDSLYTSLKFHNNDTEFDIRELLLEESSELNSSLKKFVRGARWEEITIRFLNGEDAIIMRSGKQHQTSYAAMGFQDKRNNTPNSQWLLLRTLSLSGGTWDWENARRSGLPKDELLKFKKKKQLLSITLINNFNISDDPFYDYRKEGLYRIKIQLQSEKYDSPVDNHDDIELGKLYEEQIPSKYEGPEKSA